MNSEASWTTKKTWATLKVPAVVLLFRRQEPCSNRMKRRLLRKKTKKDLRSR